MEKRTVAVGNLRLEVALYPVYINRLEFGPSARVRGA